MSRPKKQIEEPQISSSTPSENKIKPATYNHIGVEYKLYKLDDFLYDPRIGDLDWAEPNLKDLDYNNIPKVQPFGKLISFFIYRPFLEMDGGTYDTIANRTVGTAAQTLDYRPNLGRLDKKVWGDARIKFATVPYLKMQQNLQTGQQEKVWAYTDKDILINNQFSNAISNSASRIYNTKTTQSLQLATANMSAQFVPPSIPESEAQAILNNRYSTSQDNHNITACTATKDAIRRNSEYQIGNIQEFVLMSLGEEILYDPETKEKITILEKDNLVLVPVKFYEDFSWTMGNSPEAKEHNKGYLTISPAYISQRKDVVARVQQEKVVNSTEIQYGADDETLRKALAYYKSMKQNG